ncbi:MAG TPA: ARMT1-like domain-containing protein, partial [Anaerolineales bacterium]|nr:ARMT1-like domain-containing protein [Anaerolineales bacterium]
MVNSNKTSQRGISKMLGHMPINLDDVREFRTRLAKSNKVVYFTDNCGEVVFDRLFVETLLNEYRPQITFVTRSVPVLNDVTVELAESVGLGKLGRVMGNGIAEPFPGTLLNRVSPEVRQLVEDADLIISKGVGNYDSLTEETELVGKISFLFHGKCHPCCSGRNVPDNALIVYNA